MEFFNKKEEVLEVVLTQKGKELFASGLFKPYYYSFHDTDIIYDDNSSEEQNETVPRIYSTPRLKQNTNVFQNSSNVKSSLKFKQSLYCEIGNKTLGDQYRPSWELKFIKSPQFQYVGTNPQQPIDSKNYQIKFTSSIDLYNQNQEVIPQIDIQTNYNITSITKNSLETDLLGSKTNPFKTLADYQNSNLPGKVYYLDQDGTLEEAINNSDGLWSGKTNNLGKFMPKITTDFYLVKDPQVIVNISEYNSFENYEKQEFEIDAFYVEGQKVQELTFNKDLQNNIYKFLNILFDNSAEFDIKINTKDIYGNMVEKDESNC